MQPSGVKVILQFGEGEDAGVPWWWQEMESQRGYVNARRPRTTGRSSSTTCPAAGECGSVRTG